MFVWAARARIVLAKVAWCVVDAMSCLMHDFRVMAKGKSKICLSELALGMPLPPAYNAYCSATLPIQTLRKLQYAEAYKPEQALKDDVVNELYEGQE